MNSAWVFIFIYHNVKNVLAPFDQMDQPRISPLVIYPQSTNYTAVTVALKWTAKVKSSD